MLRGGIEPVVRPTVILARLVAHADNATFAELEYETGTVVVLASATEAPGELWRSRFSLNEGVAGHVAATGKAVLVDEASTFPSFRRIGDRRIGSILAVPVDVGGRTAGVLTVTKASSGAFSPETVEVLRAVAEALGASLVAAQRAQSLARLGELAHDLQTPINAVRGFLDLASDDREGTLKEPRRSYLRFATMAAEQMVHISGDMRDVLHVSQGNLKLHLGDVCPEELLRNVVTTCHQLAAEVNVSIRLAADPGVPSILADERRVQRILMNLVNNAVKYAPGGTTVWTSVRRAAEGGVLFCVDDEGPGMAEDETIRLFEPNYQGEVQPARDSDGLGLGLSIAHALAVAHGGHLAAENRSEGGARFMLHLPAMPPGANAAAIRREVHVTS